MGRHVIAVDAMADNLAYIRYSLEHGDDADKVVLVHNPIRYTGTLVLIIITHTIIIISDSHVTLFPVPYDNDTDIEENPGSQKLVEEQELQDSHLMV